MAKQLRVHTLAKELSVSSKDILEKCRAEGIDILQTHNSAVPIGLAESIREWFSGGEHATSVEEAAPVDLKKVRKPRKRAAAKEPPEAAAEPAPAPPSQPATAGVPEGPAAAPAPAPVEIATGQEPGAPVSPLPAAPAEAPALTPAPEPIPIAAQAPAQPVVAQPPPAPTRGPLTIERPAAPPAPPEPIRPAGPQVVPRPAELKGPRVVRIEAPEPVRIPRPRPVPLEPALPIGGGPSGPGLGARGRGKHTREEERELVRSKARSPRRHGTGADVVERVREWRDQDLLERKERLASATGHGLRDRRAAERRRQTAAATGVAVQPARRAEVEIVVPISVKDLCAALGAPFNVVSAKLLEHTGQLFTINQFVDADQAEMVALELGISLRVVKPKTELEKLEAEVAERRRDNLVPRPPVVAMLGHVDHGKTSLLDAIRKTRVAAGEAGGITQHVGAYRLTRGGWDVTFLDTPGHEAFTAMRARGANLTDVVVLVVAADDGVMPQTIEAINHARAAHVPIVVALNKVDLPGVDFNRLYAQLAEQDLTPTEWGGSTDVIRTSAIKGQGIDELVAHLSTLSELLDLKADPTVPAQGVVIEAQLAEGRGVVAQVLVREGTLRLGQVIVCGEGYGRVRSLLDDSGRRIREATPGTPVEVGGLDVLPRAGDKLYVVEDLSRAKRIAEEVRAARRAESLVAVRKPQTLEELLRGDERGEVPELNVIVKADGQASVDALRSKLAAFPSDKARLRLLHSGVGAISEADVMLAQTSRAVIFGFWVTAEERARQLAEQVGVEIRLYRVIYEIIEDMQKALEGLLAPLRREESRGRAEVLQIFNIAKVGTVAGCVVRDGLVARSNRVRLIRDGRIVMEDLTIGSLKRFKEDAREVRAGLECGIKIEAYDDLKPGDVIEAYEVVEVAQRL